MKLAINQIQSNIDNPRIIKSDKFKKLVNSIKEFPEMLELRPIVIDENNIILGGNMRYKACIEAGLNEVPVKIAKNLSEKQKQEFIVKDNINFGEWDWDILGNDWSTKELTDWGLDVWQNEDDINETNLDDMSSKISAEYKIEIECVSEKEQEEVYNDLINKGYICRLLTL